MLYRLILVFGLLTINVESFSQRIVNVYVLPVFKSDLVVYYSLEGEKPGDRYQVDLYCSIDGFTEPLTNVTGEVGDNVLAGNDKKILWVIDNEARLSKTELKFEVRAKLFNPLIKINDLTAGKVFKIGKTYSLSWQSLKKLDKLKITLYNGRKRMWTEAVTETRKEYNWAIPKTVKPGDYYRFKFSNNNDSTDVLYSPIFRIKQRMSPISKIACGATIGIVTYFILNSKKQGPTELPSPPGYPNHP